MQSVPAPAGLTRPAGAFAVALLATCAVTLGLAAVADAPSPSAPKAPAVYRGLIGGVALQSARCVQWNAGTGAEREQVVGALAYSVGGATPYGNGTTLASAQAHSLFDRACASPVARGWLLYELYIRAAGFRSYAPR
ncbi:MAG: hypothetical protein QOH76_473 [Thermoleophilaceae bacterium]|nr:hypothetical protein [Thermoleophilaceae bacterium]